jgi:hypothetical protein
MADGENGVGIEVPATVEPADGARARAMPSLEEMAVMFEKMSPEERKKLVEIGTIFQRDMAAAAGAAAPTSPFTASVREAVAKPEAPKAEPPKQDAPKPSGPDFPGTEPPAGFSSIPESVYLWTAQGSLGLPLWGMLGQGRPAANGSPGRLVFKLFKAAHAFSRSGKKVVVPPGGLVMVTLTDALEPLLGLAQAKDAEGKDLGCAAIWLRATGEIQIEGGRTAPTFDLRWEHSPDDPRAPRFYPRELFAKAS